jgi:hypothetical protein
VSRKIVDERWSPYTDHLNNSNISRRILPDPWSLGTRNTHKGYKETFIQTEMQAKRASCKHIGRCLLFSGTEVDLHRNTYFSFSCHRLGSHSELSVPDLFHLDRFFGRGWGGGGNRSIVRCPPTKTTAVRKSRKVRFEVLTETSVKMAVLWDHAPCSLVEIDRRFREAICLHRHLDDGSSKPLWNVGKFYWLHSATSQKTAIFEVREVHKKMLIVRLDKKFSNFNGTWRFRGHINNSVHK